MGRMGRQAPQDRADLDPRLLRGFVAVAEEGHFGNAASRLAIAQPALSRQIQQLERQLGLELFTRTPRGAALTAAGARILPEARQALAQNDWILQVSAMLAGGPVAAVRIAAPMPLPSQSLIAQALREFRRDYPEVPVEVLELPDQEQAAAVSRGDIDLALSWDSWDSWDEPDTPGLLAEPLLTEKSYAVVPAGHALSALDSIGPKDLSSYPVLFPVQERGHCWHLLRTAADASGVSIRPVQTAPSAVLNLVRGGLGISVVPGSFRLAADPELAFIPVADQTNTTTLLRRATGLPATVQRFVAQTRDAAAALADEHPDVWTSADSWAG